MRWVIAVCLSALAFFVLWSQQVNFETTRWSADPSGPKDTYRHDVVEEVMEKVLRVGILDASVEASLGRPDKNRPCDNRCADPNGRMWGYLLGRSSVGPSEDMLELLFDSGGLLQKFYLTRV